MKIYRGTPLIVRHLRLDPNCLLISESFLSRLSHQSCQGMGQNFITLIKLLVCRYTKQPTCAQVKICKSKLVNVVQTSIRFNSKIRENKSNTTLGLENACSRHKIPRSRRLGWIAVSGEVEETFKGNLFREDKVRSE
jgi:hypothetical protein